MTGWHAWTMRLGIGTLGVFLALHLAGHRDDVLCTHHPMNPIVVTSLGLRDPQARVCSEDLRLFRRPATHVARRLLVAVGSTETERVAVEAS